MSDKRNKVLKRADFDTLARTNSDIGRSYVHVPEWATTPEDAPDTYVCIRGLTGTERDNFEGSVVSFKGNDKQVNLRNIRAKLVAMVLIDEDTGERLYSDTEVALLGNRSAAALTRVFEAAQRLSGLTDSDVKELAAELKNGQSA